MKNISNDSIKAAIFEYTNWTSPDDYLSGIRVLVKLMSAAAFFAPVVDVMDVYSEELNGRTYMYLFSTRPSSRFRPVSS